jgi:hypothetical protein
MDEFKELAARISQQVEWLEEFLPQINFEYMIGDVRIKRHRGKFLTLVKDDWVDMNNTTLNTKMLILDNVKEILQVAQKERQLFIDKMQATIESFAAFQREIDFNRRVKT